MALESMPVDVDPPNQMRHSTSNASSIDGSNRELTEIEEELALATPGRGHSSVFSRNNSLSTGDKLFVAVGKEYKESKSTLIWALRKNRRAKKFILVHVHRPSQMIPIMGGWFHTSQLKTEQIEEYRVQEREKMNKTLDEYMFICEIAKVQAEKLVIEMDDIAKGLIELIVQHGITRLVMGAAADKYYSKKMRVPVSKTACAVYKEAPQSCDIWFVCKGNLIRTREDTLDGYAIPLSPLASPRTRSTRSELLRSKSASQASRFSDPVQGLLDHMPRSSSVELFGGDVDPLPEVELDGINAPQKRSNDKESLIDPQEEVPRDSQGSDPSLSSGYDDAESNLGLNSTASDEESKDSPVSVNLHSANCSKDDAQLSSAENKLGDLKIEDDWNVHLQQALKEAANLVNGAYKEAHRRCRAEREAFEASQRAKALEVKYAKEVKQREEVEESLAQGKLEIEKLKRRLDDVLEELQKAYRQRSKLENQVTDSNALVKDLEEKLSSSQHLLSSLQRERDDAVREAEELRRTREVTSGSTSRSMSFLELSYLELEQATCNFENSLKIGEGGSGCVYKGFIRHTKVVIKVLNPHNLQGRSDFRQEADNLSRLRHPNLVTLIGACPEAWTLVYEFLPNGSLEDRLACKDNTPPLSWQVRTRITAEICSALIFLHSNKPRTVVHGDVRPANILLDANFASKLSDLSINRLFIQSTTTLYNWSDPKGTFVYLDPEFFSTGELTPHSDIYSFGIILLRLLTGRPALGIVKEVQEALEKGKLQTILDTAAGDWPFKQAQQLALLGLRCCEMKRKNRPDLVREVLRILEPMKVSSLP